MATFDYRGAVIPWYEPIPAGSINFVRQEKPVAPPIEEVKQYIANETYHQQKMQERGGGGGLGGFLTNIVNPILDPMAADPLKTAAIIAATATGNAYLIPYIAGADTAIAGGSPEDVLKSAAIAYVTQAAGSEIANAGGFTGASETGLSTLAGEGIASDVGATLLNEVGTTGIDTAIDAIPDALPVGNEFAGMTPTDLATTGDTTKLADLVRAYEIPTELTPTLDPNLIDVAPDNVTIGTPEPTGTYQMGQGTSLSQDAATNPLNKFYNTANPEVSANYNTVSNLVGGGADSNLAALDALASNPLLPIGSGGIGGFELGSVGSIIGSGQDLGQQTLEQVLKPTGLSGVSVQDLASDKPVYSSDFDVKDALKKANLLRKLLTPQEQQSQLLKNVQASQQQSNMANVLRGTQMPQTMIPSIYKQQNPFNFGQQNQPVQDTNALANLLRTA
jgi:hypothetical protein